MQKLKIGDKVMGFVTIRTGRRELRRGTIVKEEEGRFKLDSGIWATDRELVLQDQQRLDRAVEYWHKYGDTLDEAERLYNKAMTTIYLQVDEVICKADISGMPFSANKTYPVTSWTNEGLSVINDKGEEQLIAAVPVGDQPTADRWFRQYLSILSPAEDDC